MITNSFQNLNNNTQNSIYGKSSEIASNQFLNNSKLDRESFDKLVKLLNQKVNKEKKLQDQIQIDEEKIQDLNQALQNSKKLIQKISLENEDWKKKYDAKDLKIFQQTRYFIKVMKLFRIRMIAFGFMKIFKRKEKAKESLMNVPERIKARLILQTRNLSCGQDIMSSYFKWWLKSKPDFIREQISKIPLTGRINQHISFWRMKKLVFKPIIKKIPESAKAYRRLQGIFFLHKIMKTRIYLDQYHFMVKANPYHTNKDINTVHKILERLFQNQDQKKRHGLNSLKKNRDYIKDIFRRLYEKRINQQRIAFWLLRNKNRSEKQFQDMMKIQNILDKLSKNKYYNTKKFVQQIRDQNQKEKNIFENIKNSMNNKKVYSYHKIMKTMNDDKFKQFQDDFELERQNLLKKYAALLIKDNQLGLQSRLFNKLRQHKNDVNQDNQNEQEKERKLRNLFNNLTNKQNNKKLSAVGDLKNNLYGQQNLENKKKKLLENLFNNLNGKKDSGLHQLKKNKLMEQILERKRLFKLQKLLNLLEKSQKGKQKQSFKFLKKTKKDFENFLKKFKQLLNKQNLNSQLADKQKALQQLRNNLQQKKQEDERLKNLKHLAIMLKNGLQRKSKTALLLLTDNFRNSYHEQMDRNKLLRNVFNKQLNRQRLCEYQTVQKLQNNKNQLKDKEENEKNILKKIFNNGYKNIQNQKKKAYQDLKRYRLIMKNKIQDAVLFDMINNHKDNLRKYFNLLRKNNSDLNNKEQIKNSKQNNFFENLLNAQRKKKVQVLNGMNSSIQNMRNEQEKDRLKKSRILNYLLMQQRYKTMQAFYRLILNKLKQDQILKNLEKKKTNFLNYLLRLNNKKRNAFQKLQNNYKNSKDNQNNQKDILNNIFQNYMNKKTQAINKLQKNNQQQNSSHQINDLQDQIKYIERIKFLKDFLNKLRESQFKKANKIFQILKKNNQEKNLQNGNLREAQNSILQKIIKKQMFKERKAFNYLMKQNNDSKNDENQQQEQYKKSMMQLGATNNEVDLLIDFKKLIEQKDYERKIKQPTEKFLNLVEYMKLNDYDENYEPLLSNISLGNINNCEELLKEIQQSRGKFDRVLDQYENPRLEMDNILHWIKLNNKKGKFNQLLQELKQKPEFNKLDIIKHIEKQNYHGNMNDLKRKINFSTYLDYLLHYMKTHNQNGQYQQLMDEIKANPNPKLSDLINIALANNNDDRMKLLLKKINNSTQQKQINNIVNFMRKNNCDQRFDSILQMLSSSRKPRLSQVALMLRRLTDSKYDQLKDLLNQNQPSVKQRIQNIFNEHDKNDEFKNFKQKVFGQNYNLTNLIKAYQNDENKKQIEKFIENEGQVQELLNYIDDNQIQYLSLYQYLKSIPNVQKTDILEGIRLFQNEKENYEELIQKFEESQQIEELRDYLQRKNKNNKYQVLLDELIKSPNLYTLYQYIYNNKNKIDYKPVLQKINGQEKEIQSLKNQIIQIIENYPKQEIKKPLLNYINQENLSTIQIIQTLCKNNVLYNDLIKQLEEKQQPEQIETLNNYMLLDYSNPDYTELKKMIIQKEPLTHMFNFILDNKNRMSLGNELNILDQENELDLYQDCLKVISRNYFDAKFVEFQNHLESLENPSVINVLQYIDSQPSRKPYQNILNEIDQKNQTDRVKNIFKWIQDYNFNGRHNQIIEYLDGLEYPIIQDIINYANKNNQNQQYNSLLKKLLGRNLTSKQLVHLLQQNQIQNEYQDLIEDLEQNPIDVLYPILQKIKQHLSNEDAQKIIDFIFGENDCLLECQKSPDYKLNKMLKNKYPGFYQEIKEGKLKSPQQVLQTINEDYEQVKYKPLIEGLQNFIQKHSQKHPLQKRLNLIRSQKEKQKNCLQKLRNYNKYEKMRLKYIQERMKNMMNNFMKYSLLSKLRYLNELKNNRKEQIKQEKKLDKKRKRVLIKLINAHDSKKVSCMIQLNNNLNEYRKNQKFMEEKLGTLFGLQQGFHEIKLQEILNKLRNNNTVKKQMINLLAQKLRDSQLNKQKQSLEKLTDNNKKIKQKLGNQDNFLKNLLGKNFNLKLKNCFNDLRRFNQEEKLKNSKKQNTIYNVLKKMVQLYEISKKKHFDNLQAFNQEQNLLDQKNKFLKNILMNKLGEKHHDNLRKYLDELRLFNENEKLNEEKKQNKIKSMLNKLANQGKLNQNIVMQNLYNNNKEIEMKEGQQLANHNLLLNDLKNSQNSKLRQILEQLRRNNLKEQMNENEKFSMMENLFGKMQQSLRAKSTQSLDNLVLNNRDQLNKQKKIIQMLQKLDIAQRAKQNHAQQQLKKNNYDYINKERRDNERLKKIFQFASRKLITKPFYKLIENCLLMQKREKIIDNNLRSMDLAWKLKESKNLHEISKNLMEQKLLDEVKRQILQNISNSYKNKNQIVLQNLISNVYTKKNRIQESLKVVRKNVFQDVHHFYKILKMQNYLSKRNKLTNHVNQMFFCLRKNHKAQLREALNHWAGTKLKNKVKNATSILEKIIIKRENQGFQSIKKQYLYLKFERFINGMMKLVKFIEGRVYSDKEFFWNRFYEKNLWFQRVVDIWTIRALPNNQIAFWKMRYAKELKQDGISAEKALKLKKLLHLLNMKIQSVMSHGFWTIIHANPDLRQSQQPNFMDMLKKKKFQ